MYCKHCRKQIADDSKYCQHCGEPQEEIITNGKPKRVIEIPNIINNLSDKAKKWLGLYAIWFILNFTFMFLGGYDDDGSEFFPIKTDSIRFYDFSEFLVYAILLPTIVFVGYKWYHSRQKKRRN